VHDSVSGGIGGVIGAVGHHVLRPGWVALKEGDGLPEIPAPGGGPHAGAAVAFLGIIQALAHGSPARHPLLPGPLEVDAVALEDVEQRVLKAPRIVAHTMRVHAPPAAHLMDGFGQFAGRPAEPKVGVVRVHGRQLVQKDPHLWRRRSDCRCRRSMFSRRTRVR
jgi:hypothetical protein